MAETMIISEWKSIVMFTLLIAYVFLVIQLLISFARLSTMSTGMIFNDCHLTLLPTHKLIFCDSGSRSDPLTLHFAGDESPYLAGWMRFLDLCMSL
jgi:hypothetical protein